MSYRDKLAKKADLAEGERMLAGATATPAGGLRRNATFMGAGAAIGVIGAAAATVQQAADRNAPEPPTAFPTASKMAIGLTDRRILVWGLGVMTGGPSKLLGEVPTSSVRSVAWGTDTTMGMRNGVLELTLADGTAVALEIPRVHLKDGEALAATLQSMVPTVD